MKSLLYGHGRVSISASCFLGFALTLGSVSLFSGCDSGKSEMKMIEQKDDPAVIAKDSMNFYKDSHTKGGAPKKN
jgi:hypothetical protein